MWLKTFGFLLIFLFSMPQAFALRVSGGIGFGEAEMTNEDTETEGPLTQAWTVERLFHSKLAFGVEHLRSLKTNFTTSASFSGLLGRYYLNTSPTKIASPESLSYERIVNHDVALFLRMGIGFAQSSRLPNDVGLSSNVAGLYISPGGGLEYQMTEHIGLRGEVYYARSIAGEGTLTMFSVGGGLYWLF